MNDANLQTSFSIQIATRCEVLGLGADIRLWLRKLNPPDESAGFL